MGRNAVRSLKIELTRQIKAQFEGANWTAKNPKIKEVTESFNENMGRVLGISSLALGLFNSAWMLGTVTGNLKGRSQRHPALSGPGKEESERIEELLRYIHDNGSVADWKTIEDGLAAVLSSMIIGTWTAFETMAADLWELVVNEKPTTGLKQYRKKQKERGHEVERISFDKIGRASC